MIETRNSLALLLPVSVLSFTSDTELLLSFQDLLTAAKATMTVRTSVALIFVSYRSGFAL